MLKSSIKNAGRKNCQNGGKKIEKFIWILKSQQIDVLILEKKNSIKYDFFSTKFSFNKSLLKIKQNA